MLSPRLLEVLRDYWRMCAQALAVPWRWRRPITSPQAVEQACKKAHRAAGITSPSRRTRCATPLPRICWRRAPTCARIQLLLGHRSLATTSRYLKIATSTCAPPSALVSCPICCPDRTRRRHRRRRRTSEASPCAPPGWRWRRSSARSALTTVAPCRLAQPRAAARDERDRALPHRRAGRARRAVRRLRPPAHRLQLLPQPPLPEVPGLDARAVAGGAPRRAAPGRILPRGVHPAAPIAALAYQNKALSTTCCSRRRRRRCARRRRPAAPGRRDRLPGRAAHLGPEPAAPPASALRRARRRHLARRQALDRLPAGVLPAGAGAVPAVPGQVPRAAAGGVRAQGCSSSAPWRRCKPRSAFERFLAPAASAEWVVYAKPPFGGPEQVLKYLARYTHRVAISNSRLVASATAGRVPLEGLRHDGKPKAMRLTAAGVHRGASCCTCCPRACSASATTGCWPTATRDAKLERCRELLGVGRRRRASTTQTRTTATATCGSPGVVGGLPACRRGRMTCIETFLPRPPSQGPPADTHEPLGPSPSTRGSSS